MRRFRWTAAAFVLLAAALVSATPAASPNFPAHINLPTGWVGEGIAVGRGHTFYAGNSATGAVYAGDLRTGDGDVLVPAVTGRAALGVFADNCGRLWVAGGSTGHAYVYDASSGQLLQDYTLAPTTPRFINDVYVTNDAAYFTNTSASVLYRIPIEACGDVTSTFDTIPLPTVPAGSGLNGIEATPDGKTLIVVAFLTGRLYAIDTETFDATEIPLTEGGVSATVSRGDGLVLAGRTLYVVQNLLDGVVAVVDLAPDLSSGEIVNRLDSTDEPLVNPATADRFGHLLYVVRRNDAPVGPTRVFWLTKLEADKG